MKAKRTAVPIAMQVQLSRLFGSESRIASRSERSDAEWKRDLKLVLAEIWDYLDTNIETDIVHRRMIHSGFMAADHALTEEIFWPGYVEGITRILLCLLGDYPDHRKRKTGTKKSGHYRLSKDRSLTFTQTRKQRSHMLFWSAPALLELQSTPLTALHDFRDEVGLDVPIEEFVSWYKARHPEDYLKVF